MILLFFASSVCFAIFLSCRLVANRQAEAKAHQSYLERERLANQTRKQSLDSLDYLTIPDELLSVTSPAMTDEIIAAQRTLEELSTQVIVNLTGISNTDLKLTYGVANLPILTEYDLRYTKLSRTLNILGQFYYHEGEIETAKSFLHYAIETGTDIKPTYQTLAIIYRDEDNADGIQKLFVAAESLGSISKPIIVQMLQEFGPYNGSLDS